MNIIIGADLVPTKSNVAHFINGDAEYLLGEELKQLLDDADFKIFNLEVPLTDKLSPIKKCGPALIAPAASINGYKAVGVDLVTVANNHILDQGEQGLRSTIQLLKDNAIDFVGAGNTPEEAALPYIFECADKKIGVYACAEHEFSIVTNNSSGANPFDYLCSFGHISALKEKCDFVIVLYHGGKEHYRYPSPMLQKVCKKMIDSGADLVLCQHSHCIGCEEKYNGGTIVYGQGNFLFDHSKSEFWQTSLLVKISKDFNISYIPLIKQQEKVRLATGDDGDKILKDFSIRSSNICKNGFVEKEYKVFAKEMLNGYLINFAALNKSFVFRALNRLTKQKFGKWYLKRKYSCDSLLAMYNFINCEAHRELIEEGLKKRLS